MGGCWMREEIELVAYSAVGLLVLEHLSWWLLRLRSLARPWPPALLPALAAGVGLALTMSAVVALQTLIVFEPSFTEEIRNYVRPMVVGGIAIAYLAHHWWRRGVS